ncbi:MAG: FCD domain-containing protein [Bacteroidota bacterium]
MCPQLGKEELATSPQIEEKLTEAIRNGTYRPSQRIPEEEELSRLYHVSKDTIREAIHKLDEKGVLTIKKGKGVYVSEISIRHTSEMLNNFFLLSSDSDIMFQTIHTRLMVEPTIASQAALNRNKEHVDMLKENLHQLRQCDLENLKLEIELDNTFHRTILSIANNSILELLFSPIFHLTPKFKTELFAKVDVDLLVVKNLMLEQHQNILDAIEKKNAEAASSLMKIHIFETMNNYLKNKDGH